MRGAWAAHKQVTMRDRNRHQVIEVLHGPNMYYLTGVYVSVRHPVIEVCHGPNMYYITGVYISIKYPVIEVCHGPNIYMYYIEVNVHPFCTY